jgi:hypothetical protein
MREKVDYTFYALPTLLRVNALNENALRKNLKLTDEEINFMRNLEFCSYDEPLPVRKNGKKTDKLIKCDPICVALYDSYYGGQIYLENYIEFPFTKTIPDKYDVKSQMELAKSIFNKYNPEKFNNFF